MLADGELCDDLSVIGVEYHHLFICTAGKKPVRLLIHGKACGAFTRIQLHTANDFEFFHIDTYDLTLVFDIYIHVPCPVRNGKLRSAAKRNSVCNLSRCRSDNGGTVTAAIARYNG